MITERRSKSHIIIEIQILSVMEFLSHSFRSIILSTVDLFELFIFKRLLFFAFKFLSHMSYSQRPGIYYHHALSDSEQPGICYNRSRHMASTPYIFKYLQPGQCNWIKYLNTPSQGSGPVQGQHERKTSR